MRRAVLVLFSLGVLSAALRARGEDRAAPPLLGAAASFRDGTGAFRASQLPRLFDRSGARPDLDAEGGAVVDIGVIGPARPRGVAPAPPPAAGERPLLVETPEPPPPEYERTFRSLEAQPERIDRFDELILRYADGYGLDPRLVKAVVAAESQFRAKAVSPAGAMGLMQLMPRTARELGVRRRQLFDPERNIRAGAAYLARLFCRVLGVERLARSQAAQAPMWALQRVLAAYNAGPRFLYRDRAPRRIRAYVRKVLLYYRSRVSGFASEPGDWSRRPESGDTA